jgi:hypothetical protein
MVDGEYCALYAELLSRCEGEGLGHFMYLA